MNKRLSLFVAMILLSQFIFAQNPNYRSGITFKNLFLDYQSQQGGKIEAFKDYHHGFEVGYQRKFANKLYLYVPIKIANIDVYDTIRRSESAYDHTQIAGIDGQLQYHFYNTTNKIVPYLTAGLGGVYEFESGEANLQVPMGIGVNFRAADNAYINLQSEYRYSLAEYRNNLHHAIGFVYLFGKKMDEEMPKEEPKMEEKIIEQPNNDIDGDGIENKYDLCPDAKGSKSMNGCPDADEDGIADFQDKCPDVKGLISMMGCPDADGDGITDSEDECPTQAGTKSNKGCPEKKMDKDTDGDGVPDHLDKCVDFYGKGPDGCPQKSDKDGDGIADDEDRCPDMKGVLSLNGCPDTDGDGIADPEDKCPRAAGLKVYGGCPDSDGDGLDDSIDKCPNTPGTVASNGCPDIKIEDKKTLDIAMRAVQFETGKATLKTESFAILRQIASILSRYPDYNLAIAGHTDNTGNSVANQELSEKRAKACHDYLITQGIAPDRMSYVGFGESRPVADNTTENGRSLNRRVEFNLNPR